MLAGRWHLLPPDLRLDFHAFIGSALLVSSWDAVFAGTIEALSPVAAVAALPIAVWELSLGVYLTVRGFRNGPSFVTTRSLRRPTSRRWIVTLTQVVKRWYIQRFGNCLWTMSHTRSP